MTPRFSSIASIGKGYGQSLQVGTPLLHCPQMPIVLPTLNVTCLYNQYVQSVNLSVPLIYTFLLSSYSDL